MQKISKIFSIYILLITNSLFSSPAFFLGTDRSFSTDETPHINLEGPGNATYSMRVYRVDAPEAFIHKHLEKRHVFQKEDEARGNPIALFKKTWSVFKKDFEKVARKELNSKTRIHIKKSLQVNTRNKESYNLAVPALLKEHTYLYSRTIPPGEKNWDYRRIPLPIDAPGLYLVEAINGRDTAYTVIIKSEIQFITKQSASETLIFAASRKTGAPLGNVNISVYDSLSGVKTKEGTTRSDGSLFFASKSPTKSLIFARKDNQYALSDPDFYAKSFYGEGGTKAFIYTDRPVYKPGDSVFFKGIVRNFNHDSYHVTSGTGTIDLETDAGGIVLQDIAVDVNNGSFAGELQLPSEQNVYRGNYSLVLNFKGERFATELSLESYKKPPFKVSISTDKKIYFNKETVQVSIQARYYHGVPLANAKTKVRIFRSPKYSISPVGTIPFLSGSMAYLGYGDESPERELVLEKDLQTDKEGKTSLEIKPDKAVTFNTRPTNDQDYVYSVISGVSDSSITLSNSTSFAVNRGQFYIDIQRENTVYNPGDMVKMKAELVPFDKTLSPENRKKMIAGRSVKVSVFLRQFHHISRETQEKKITEQTAMTNAAGMAEFAFRVSENGHFSVIMATADSDGNDLVANTTLWASAVSDSIDIPYNNLVMKAGKDIYAVGETAEILIFSPVKSGNLFLTVEGNHIIKYETVNLKGNVYKYRISLNEQMAPNFSLGAVLFVGGEIYKSDIKVVVPPQEKFLQVGATTDKKIYRPGEMVHLTIDARDYHKNPVSAEVSVSVVDEAIFQIQPDRNPSIITFFYHPRRNDIETTLSSAFRFFGYAETKRMKLALLNRTNSPLASVKDAEVQLRSEFEDTAYWNAKVKTDNLGKAAVSFKVPDNLTTWKIKTVAVTAATQVGEAKNEFISRKDIMINSGLPGYMTYGKEQTVSAKVTNLTSKTQESTVTIAAENAVVTDGINFVKLSLKAGETRHIYFRLKTGTSGDAAKIKMAVIAGNLRDGFEEKVPLREFGVEKTDSFALYLEGEKQEISRTFSPNGKVNPTDITLRFSPGYGAALRQSLSYLAGYPYGCIEQTMSRFMPLLAAKKAGFISPGLKAELPAMVETGLEKISQNQNLDGGFSWFMDRKKSDPIMSAWVYRGLAISKKLKQKVNEALLNQTRRFLYNELEHETFTPTARAYILSALAEGGKLEISMVNKLVELASGQTSYGLALTGLTLQSIGDNNRATDFYNKALAKSSAINNPLIPFKPAQELEQDEVEFTAVLLMLAIRLQQPEDTINNLATALLQNRRNEAWNNSRDTAMAVLALAEMAEKIRDTSKNTDLTIMIDNQEVKSLTISADKLFDNEFIFSFPLRENSKKPLLQIHKKTGASLHVVASFNYFDSSETLAQINHGLSIKREYSKMGSNFIGNKNEFSPGDLVMVTLEVEAAKDNRYFLVQDFIPPGFSFVKNDSGYYSAKYSIEYDSRQILDDKAVFFVSGGKNKFTIRYFLSAGLPGSYSAIPAKASLMYYPEVYGMTGNTMLQVNK